MGEVFANISTAKFCQKLRQAFVIREEVKRENKSQTTNHRKTKHRHAKRKRRRIKSPRKT